MDMAFLERMAKALARQFGANCEVVVHDLTADDSAHTIAVIENGHVSERHRGDGASRVVLEAMQRRSDASLHDEYGYLTKTADGRILKSSTLYLRSEQGVIDAIFSINYDVTELMIAERALGTLLAHTKETTRPERIPTNVNDLLDDLIAQSVEHVGKPVAMMTKEDKTEAVRFLNKAGAFLVTRSGDKVSKFFGISKYTLYSYIDAKKNEPETGKAEA